MKNKTSKAFSLIELSIVILVIGILIAGVTQGSKLYDKFKLQTARQLTQSSPVAGIKDLFLWLDATSEKAFDNGSSIENSTALQNWYDINPQRTEKNNLTQTTSSNKPVYVEKQINGLPSVKFDGTNDFLSNSNNTALNAPNTVFVVCNIIDLVNPLQTLIARRDSATSSGSYLIRVNSSSETMQTNFIASSSAGPSRGLSSNNNPYIVTTSIREGLASIWLNGSGPSSNSSFSGYSNNLQSAPLSIGATTNTTTFHYFKGYISEVIIFSRYLTQEERREVEKYLSKKYNIQLPY